MKYTVDCTRYTNCNYSIQKVHVLTFSKVAANPFWSVTNGIWWTKPTFGFFSLHARSRMISDEAVEKGEKKKDHENNESTEYISQHCQMHNL